MRSLEEPEAPRGRSLWILLGMAMVAVAAVIWYATSGPPVPVAPSTQPVEEAPSSGPPSSGNERPTSTERATGAPSVSAPAARTNRKAETATPATPAPAPRELRVTSDVPGAYVFLNRKFLGTTPLTSRDVSPGSYQLNVQVEGRPPVVQSVDIAAEGPTEVAVTLPAAPATSAAAAAINADVAVVHQHGMGSCEGTLRATGDGLRYETAGKDAFTLRYANVETFSIDYTEKRLRLKQRGGRTWNFTTKAPTADPLFVFHRDVEAARPKP